MAQSTITDKFQTTIPLEVRLALNLRPRQRVSYEVRGDGSAVMRPAPGLDDLFGSLKLKRAVASPRVEKQAARQAMARAAAPKGCREHAIFGGYNRLPCRRWSRRKRRRRLF